jgi:hypothetical protein
MHVDLEETIFDSYTIQLPDPDYISERMQHMNDENCYLFSFIDTLIHHSSQSIYHAVAIQDNPLSAAVALHASSAARKMTYLEDVQFYDMIERSYLSQNVSVPYVSPLSCERLLLLYNGMEQDEMLDFCFDINNDLKRDYPMLVDGMYLMTEFAGQHFSDLVDTEFTSHFHISDDINQIIADEFSRNFLISLSSLAACMYKGTATSLQLPGPYSK